MTNHYSMQIPYQGTDNQMYQQGIYQNPSEVYYQGNYNPQIYAGNPQSGSLAGKVIKGAALGFAGGAIVTAGVDYFKNRKPVNNNGEVSENFANRVMDRIISKNYVAKGKAFFNQKMNVLRNIDASKTPEKFKKLMQKNKAFCNTLFDSLSLDTVCKTVTEDNVKEKIAAVKQRIQASLSTEIQNIKDAVSLCWDKENKKFTKPKEIDSKLFNIIKNTTYDINWKKVGKYGGITAGITAAAGLIYGIFTGKPQQ